MHVCSEQKDLPQPLQGCFVAILGPRPLQKCVGDFCSVLNLQDFAGDFPGGIFWTLFFRERPPGLIEFVLTVLVFWSWVLLVPRFPPSSRSLRLFSWASILLHGPVGRLFGCRARSSPTAGAKTGPQHIWVPTNCPPQRGLPQLLERSGVGNALTKS